MKKRLIVMGAMAVLAALFTLPVLAEGAPLAEKAAAADGWMKVLPVFAMALASAVCGLGQSKGHRGGLVSPCPATPAPRIPSGFSDPRPRPHRVPGPLHPPDHLRQVDTSDAPPPPGGASPTPRQAPGPTSRQAPGESALARRPK